LLVPNAGINRTVDFSLKLETKTFNTTTAIRVVQLKLFTYAAISAFSPSIADAVVEIGLEFEVGFHLESFEPIVIRLPGFTGRKRTYADDLKGPDGNFFAGAWIPEDSMLVLYVRCGGTTLEPNRRVKVSVPSALGIKSPPAGIDLNDPSLTIQAYTGIGTVPELQLDSSSGIGKLNSSELRIFPPRAGSQVELHFIFTPESGFVEGTRCLLYLPGFTGEDRMDSGSREDGDGANWVTPLSWNGYDTRFVTETCTMTRNFSS
jgi:hypothetical protein